MGRFFLLIMVLKMGDKINQLLQHIFFVDLSRAYYELFYHIEPISLET